MKMNVMFPSNYLKANDVTEAGGEMPLVIRSVAMKALKTSDGGEETKPVISFEGIEKNLILNKTNAVRISAILNADDSDLWIGKTITLVAELVDAFGKTQPAIRVKLGDQAQSQGAQPEPKNAVKASEFWSYAYGELKLSPEEGNKIIAEHGGDIGKALEAIQAQKDMM